MTSPALASNTTQASLATVIDERFERSARGVESFFAEHDELVARACLEVARRFARGGRLLVYGEGSQRSDAEHVAVEFVHPVIVGKRALPAMAVGSVRGGISPGASQARELRTVGQPEDIVMAIDAGQPTGTASPTTEILRAARELGMLTLYVAPGSPPEGADLVFRLDDNDPLVAQEVAETLYHVIWELVHVFLDRRDLMAPERSAADRSGSEAPGRGEAAEGRAEP